MTTKKNTAKKATENKKNANKRVTNNKTQQAAARQKAKEQEAAQKAKEAEKATAAALKEQAAEIRATFGAARQEVKAAHTPLYYFHLLNRMAEGKEKIVNVSAPALAKAYEMTESATPTAYGRKGFSFDVVKVDSRGRICKLVAYTPATGDETEKSVTGATVVTTKRYQGAELLTLYTGDYLMIPVPVNESGLLSAVESYLQAYAAAYPDLIAVSKRISYARQQRAAQEAEKAKRDEIQKAVRAAMETANAALKAAEEAERQTDADRQRATVAAFTAPDRKWWQRAAAAIF